MSQKTYNEIQDELFDNGVTTKGSEHGTGLFQVDQIVKR